MRSSCLVLAAAVALALSTDAGAQEEDFGRAGAYVGGGFVYGFENFDLDEVSQLSGTEVSASGSPGLDIRGGYRFNEYVAVEGNLDYYAGFDIDPFDAEVLSLYAVSFFASAKGYPLSGRVQPYGLFGLGVVAAQIQDDYGFDVDASDAVFAVRAGAGLDVYVTSKFLLNLDVGYVITTGDMNFGGPADIGTDIIPLAITGQYRF